VKKHLSFILKFSFSILLVTVYIHAAAHNKHTLPEEINPFANRKCNVIFPNAVLPVSENINTEILTLLRKEVANLKTDHNTIQLIKFSKSPVARHYLL